MADPKPRNRAEELDEELLEAKRVQPVGVLTRVSKAGVGHPATSQPPKAEFTYTSAKTEAGPTIRDVRGASEKKGAYGEKGTFDKNGAVKIMGNVLGGSLFVIVAISIVVTLVGALIVAAPYILGFIFVAAIFVYFLAAIFG